MNKKTLIKNLNNLKPVFIAIILLVGLSFATANNWTAPNVNNDNTAGPIHEGYSSPSQEKTGSLTVAGLINTAHSPVVTFSPFTAGSQSLDVITNFNGPLNLFGVLNGSGISSDTPLCTNSSGKIKLCADKVIFEPVQDVYYSATNAITFTGTVTGAVKYDIDPLLSCTTTATSGTNWANGTTLTGTSSSYPVTFNNWGVYVLSMDCTNNKTYSTTITIKGKIVSQTTWGTNPTVMGTQNGFTGTQKYFFSTSKVIEIRAQGGGAGGSGTNPVNNGGSDGMAAFAHVTTNASWTPNSTGSGNPIGAKYNSGASLVHAGGGYALYAQGPTQYAKGGDKITYATELSNVTKSNGGNPAGSNGGCPGSTPTSCSHNEAGAGGYSSYGGQVSGAGGGGAYVSGTYTMPANNYLYIYNGDWGSGAGDGGKDGVSANLIVEWK
jgi:hypothetical protein